MLFTYINSKNLNLKNKNKHKKFYSKFKSTSKRSYLSQFTNMQKSIEKNKKSFILNEESVIKNYGAIYLENGKFHLTNNTNSNRNRKNVAELYFHKTIMTKG